MLTELNGWFNLIISILTISALAGAISAGFRVSYAKSQIEFLRTNVEMRDQKIDLLEADKSQMSQDLALADAKIEGLESKIKILQEVVTGKEQLEALMRGQTEILELLRTRRSA